VTELRWRARLLALEMLVEVLKSVGSPLAEYYRMEVLRLRTDVGRS
jgi:hypothetical protein